MFEFVYIKFNGLIQAQVFHTAQVTGEESEKSGNQIVQRQKISAQESEWTIDFLKLKYPYIEPRETTNA